MEILMVESIVGLVVGIVAGFFRLVPWKNERTADLLHVLSVFGYMLETFSGLFLIVFGILGLLH
jgi:hypothetical protein